MEACRRLGGSPELFTSLRSEVCFGPSSSSDSLLGLKPTEGISYWYERLNGLKEEPAESLWRRTIVVGHSQGAGHAMLISQKHSLAGVLMIAGPADGSQGELASWTKEEFQTPVRKRLLMVHAQDGGYRAVAAHAEASGLRHCQIQDGLPDDLGGLALVDKETMPPLSAHGCLAGSQTWATNTRRQALFNRLLKQVINQWRSAGN